MATNQHLTIVDAIEMVLSGTSISMATDFAVKHGMEHAIQFYNPQTPEHYDAWRAINREWKRRGERRSTPAEPVKSNACEFTC